MSPQAIIIMAVCKDECFGDVGGAVNLRTASTLYTYPRADPGAKFRADWAAGAAKGAQFKADWAAGQARADTFWAAYNSGNGGGDWSIGGGAWQATAPRIDPRKPPSFMVVGVSVRHAGAYRA